MKKVLEVRIGGADVVSGKLPLSSLPLLKDLLELFRADDATMAALSAATTHIDIIGKRSTAVGYYAPAPSQRVATNVSRTLGRAKRHDLDHRGAHFVESYITESAPWAYVEIAQPASKGTRSLRVVRFDQAYREHLREKIAKTTFCSDEEIYARIVRCGGAPRPTAQLHILGGERGVFHVKDQALARALGSSLYDTVKLRAEARWDKDTLGLKKLTITGIDHGWKDAHLGDLLRAHDGLLPFELSVASVDELMTDRESDG